MTKVTGSSKSLGAAYREMDIKDLALSYGKTKSAIRWRALNTTVATLATGIVAASVPLLDMLGWAGLFGVTAGAGGFVLATPILALTGVAVVAAYAGYRAFKGFTGKRELKEMGAELDRRDAIAKTADKAVAMPTLAPAAA